MKNGHSAPTQPVSEVNGTFVSTFRINDGHKKDVVKLRQRQRKVLSCQPCHRSKVKCDRNKPCARCVALGREAQCTYSTEGPSPKRSAKNRTKTPEDAKAFQQQLPTMFGAGHSISVHHTGLTHWSKLYEEFEEVKEYVFGQNADFNETFKQITNLKRLYPSRQNRNFPFGESYHGPVSRAAVVSHLPPQALVETLVENYIGSFDKTYRLLHPPSFREEMRCFWEDMDSASESWIAQLWTILSMSCVSAPDHIFADLPQTRQELAAECLDWAESAMKRSTFMSYPDLNNLRTLVMMAVAKSLDVIAPATNDGLYALVGFIVRMAMSLSLHRDPTYFPSFAPLEARMRRRIWNTIVFMDLKLATDSGLPALIRQDDWDTRAPLNKNDEFTPREKSTPPVKPEQLSPNSPAKMATRHDFDGTRVELKWSDEELKHYQYNLGWLDPEPTHVYTDSSLEIKLSQAYPIISMAVSTMNSMQPQMDYDRVLDADNKLREVLYDAQVVFANAQVERDPSLRHTVFLQRSMLEIFIRRVLLAMHRPFAQDLKEHPMRIKSHWSVLECSLALINLQQTIHEHSQGSNSVLWLMDIFQGSISCAMVYTLLSLRRDLFDRLPTDSSQQSARDTARTALRASIDICKSNLGRSFIYFKTFMGVSLASAALRAVETGGDRHAIMQETGRMIVETVKDKKGVLCPSAEEVEASPSAPPST